MEPTRIELDMPVVIFNRFAVMELANHHSVNDVLTSMFANGTVVSLHMVIESTDEVRGFCKFEDPGATYKHECSRVLSSDGACDMQDRHNAAAAKFLEDQLTGKE